MNTFLKTFKALSDQTRLRIVKVLESKDMCVCEIRAVIGFSMATISNHLKILSEANIVTSFKKDKFVNYHLNIETDIPFYQKIFELLKEVSDSTIEVDSQKAKDVNRINIC